jgi:hypothetical protein
MSGSADQNLREKEARIRQLQMDALLKAVESIERLPDMRYAPITLVAMGAGAAAILFGAAAALLKWLG